MSELLYIYGNSDWRVTKLVFAIRFWAKEVNLNPSIDTQRISNFALTLMVLFYLMNTKSHPVVLPLNKLTQLSSKMLFDIYWRYMS